MRNPKDWFIEKAVVLLCTLLAAGSTLWLLVGSVAYWVKHGWLPADTSGWVQALGALLAVAVAIAVPAWQKRHELKLADLDRKSERIDSIKAVIALTKDLRVHFQVAENEFARAPIFPGADEYRVRAIKPLARVSSSFASIELNSFGNEMVSYVLVIKSAANYALELEDNSYPYTRNFTEIARECRARITGFRLQENELSELLGALGG